MQEKEKKELPNPVFPKELMRRRWSQKEIINVVCEAIEKNGNLRKIIKEVR